MKASSPVPFSCALPALVCAAGERINHEGRLLGPQPVVMPRSSSYRRNRCCRGDMQIMPVTSPWNEDHFKTAAARQFRRDDFQASLSDLATSRRTLRRSSK